MTYQISSSYDCHACLKKSSQKPWISIDCPEGIINSCSYLCYKRTLDHIPKKHLHLIINKEDFTLPMPNIRTRHIEPLTETDINQLSDEDYSYYKSLLEEEDIVEDYSSDETDESYDYDY